MCMIKWVPFVRCIYTFDCLQSNASLEKEQQELKQKYSQVLDSKRALDQELITVQNELEEERRGKARLEQQKSELESKLTFIRIAGGK